VLSIATKRAETKHFGGISQLSLFSKLPLDGSKVIQHHTELEECDIDGIRQQQINKET